MTCKITVKSHWLNLYVAITTNIRKNIKIKYILGRIVPFWQMTRKGPYYLDRANQRHKRYPGRTMHNAGLSFTINKKMRFSLLTQNITDVLTFDTQGMPIPGRSYSMSATYMTE